MAIVKGNPYADIDLEPEVRDLVKGYTIPVSGTVVLYGPEVLLADTAEFQRLDGIKQLGMSYLVYRGSRHTRFEHSLGTLFEAERMLNKIDTNPRRPFEVTPAARRIARLAALLHDVPHIPFGHTLEDELGLLKRHDTNAERIEVLITSGAIGEILRTHLPKQEYEALISTMGAKSDADFAKLDLPYVADIIGNTLCADLLDYAKRDSHHTGLPIGLGEHFLSYLTVTNDSDTSEAVHRNRLALMLDKRGMPRPDVESEVIKLLQTRYELAERVYFHHAKNAASAMLGRAVFAAGLAFGPDDSKTIDSRFHWLSDESLLQILETPGLGPLLPSPVEIDRDDVQDAALAAELAIMLRQRRLYKQVFLAVADDLRESQQDLDAKFGAPDARRDLEDRWAALSGVPAGHVLLHLPKPKMMQKRADLRVITRGSVVTLQEWDRVQNRRLDPLNEAHRRLWRVTVFVHPSVYADRSAIERVRALAEHEFKARSRLESAEVPPFERVVFDQNARDMGWDHADLAALRYDSRQAALAHDGSLSDTIELMNARIAKWREVGESGSEVGNR